MTKDKRRALNFGIYIPHCHLWDTLDNFFDFKEYVIADELVHECELEGAVMKMRREDKTPKQRGYTNMVVLTGGEGPTDE